MPEINVLDSSMINKIAAGEVVERPSSVVKELVENSIDAGATSITIEIKEGGTSFIRITDNGCGIEKEQVSRAFLRHATSKIKDMDDLINVMTLGFRGEALSSIASVSQVELVTKTKDSDTGIKIEIEGGEIKSQNETGAADGTTFIVRNLFYNTPARRKFLKKTAVEGGYISDIVNKILLGRPDIAFKYINNGSVNLQTGGSKDLRTAVFSVFGKEFSQKMTELSFERDGFLLTGLIGLPELNRANRSYEHFYINGRFVRSDIIREAAEDAYSTRLPIRKFPVFILFLKSAPDFVDVNVHPAKMEVRFGDEELVYNLVYEAFEAALKGKNLIPSQEMKPQTNLAKELNIKVFEGEQKKLEIPQALQENSEEIKFEKQEKSQDIKNSTISVSEDSVAYKAETPNTSAPPITYINIFKDEVGKYDHAEKLAEKLAGKGNEKSNEKPAEQPAEKAFFHNYKIAGQVFSTYWIIEQDNSIYLMDQHAAHERVLYDEIKARLSLGDIVRQNLLFPAAVNLTDSEMQAAFQNKELLEKYGFEIEELGQNALAIRAVPYIFKDPADMSFFTDIIDGFLSGKRNAKNIYELKLDEIATISCKAAVKANDRLSYVEAKALIEKALLLENPFTCPHGRPTIVEITKYEVEKMFKRV